MSRFLQVKIKFPALSRFPDRDSNTLDTQAPNWRTYVPFPQYQPFGPRDGHTKFGGQPGKMAHYKIETVVAKLTTYTGQNFPQDIAGKDSSIYNTAFTKPS